MTALTEIKGIGRVTAEKLCLLGLSTAEDLLFFLPKTYLDLTEIGDVASASEGDYLLLNVFITSKSPLIRKNGRSVAVVSGESDGVKLKLVFYNRDYILNALHQGLTYRVYGKFSKIKGFHFINPQTEAESDAPKLTGILPVYPLKGRVPQQSFRNFVKDALAKLAVAPAVNCADREVALRDAFRLTHLPETLDDARRGAERILLEKTIVELIGYREEKRANRLPRVRFYDAADKRREEIDKAFPFVLNMSQKVAIATIIAGLKRGEPYNGVLTGDVGSGKTAVAFAVAAYAGFAGFQSVVMAPTELVAAQHAENAKSFFEPLGIRSALLTSSIKGTARTAIVRACGEGAIDVLFGTQAVLSEGVRLPRLAFAVADEQHRFGVESRDALFTKLPGLDTLSMSATPIPRTLQLLYFNEHEALTLAPRFRYQNIKTRIVTGEKRERMFDYLAQKAREGAKSYLVAPRISDMEGIETLGADEVYASFKKKYPDVHAGLLTGKMSLDEKQATASAFRTGKISILVATTVVEVGLDVPDAFAIAVLHADRLGLASLHQLRGRVGRAGQEAYCFLYTERNGETERLKAIAETTDGMKIAEADFKMRGAGELVGTKQHGRDKMLAGVTEDILTAAKKYADTVIF